MVKKTLTILLILPIMFSCSILFDSYKSEIDGVYIPKNLSQALSEADEFYSDSTKAEIIKMTEDEFIGRYHMGTGLWMRNNWVLWEGSRLSRYFNRKGIKHPDDMSGIILTSYHRQLTGKEINLKEQISSYKEYWKEARKINKLVQLPKKSKHPADSLEFGYSIGYNNGTTKSLLHLQTNSKTDSIWIYDYLYGWKKIGKKMESNLKSTNKFKPDSLLNVIFKE
jgi:hypothetical protein